MAKKKIILIGGGGNCKVVISILEKIDQFEIAGIIDHKDKVGNFIDHIRIIGSDDDLSKIYKSGIDYGLVTVGSIKDNLKRYQLFNMLKAIGFKFPRVISPESIMDKHTKIGEGSIVMPGCIINIDSSIGVNCIINTGATVEHDCSIGDHCHIAPGVNISGGVSVADLSFIGTGATIIQGIQIGKNATIGAGSVIIKNISDNVIAVGNPAKVIKIKNTI